VVPHAPQLSLSRVVSTHVPGAVPQFISPPVQSVVHVPLMHDSPVPHMFPHAPQFCSSSIVFAHVPSQLVSSAPQHRPLMHSSAAPVSQVVPHAPQFVGSMLTSVQPLGHCIGVVPIVHAASIIMSGGASIASTGASIGASIASTGASMGASSSPPPSWLWTRLSPQPTTPTAQRRAT
jgi:hypothetical protein